MYFLRRHGIFQEIQGFVEFLCGNIWPFEAKKAPKFFFDWKNWNLQGFCAPYGTWEIFVGFFDFFDFSIEEIMEASKKFTRQCKQNLWTHLIMEVEYYTNYPEIAVWYLSKVS